jgi:hypothetical protein
MYISDTWKQKSFKNEDNEYKYLKTKRNINY